MAYLKSKFEYKGFKYNPWVDVEPDNRKIFHCVINGDGKEIGEIPLSPYLYASEEVFKAWIDADMPSREQVNMHISGDNCCNPSEKDIITYAIEKLMSN